MRKCPFHGCERELPDTIFACRAHWFSLTKEQRARTYDVYNAYLADQLTLEKLRLAQQEILGERGTA